MKKTLALGYLHKNLGIMFGSIFTALEKTMMKKDSHYNQWDAVSLDQTRPVIVMATKIS